ncbi:hypothetical protein ILYODFUR_029599 [Ilyodon furcidens]|uniref:Uncharacterized protein n=1 Tax=Ilyodon furcidens TaxID=33524 RepID=A0ABV0SQ88_9TELE
MLLWMQCVRIKPEVDYKAVIIHLTAAAHLGGLQASLSFSPSLHASPSFLFLLYYKLLLFSLKLGLLSLPSQFFPFSCCPHLTVTLRSFSDRRLNVTTTTQIKDSKQCSSFVASPPLPVV